MSASKKEEHSNNDGICGYRIEEMIGEGSFCTVYKGVHIATGVQVAIKILTSMDPVALKNFETEIICMEQLDHPNIVKVHDVVYETMDEYGDIQRTSVAVRNPHKVYAITEYLEGGDLFQLIGEKEWFTEDDSRLIFRQLVSAVEYCHANLIAHRDIKPENILLDGYGNAKLSDFGLSSTIVPGLPFTTFCGSPGYASPEIVYNKKYNGPEIDVWSLGVVLYAMLTGRIPWKMQEGMSDKTERAFRKGRFHFPSSIPLSDAAKHLLKRMLLVDARKRATLDEVRSHRWTNYGEDSLPERYFKRQVPVFTVNETALRLLSHLGYKQRSARKSILENEPSPVVLSYHILLERMNSKPINFSVSSPNFRKSLPSQWTIATNTDNLLNHRPLVFSPVLRSTSTSTAVISSALLHDSVDCPPSASPLSSSSGVRSVDYLTRLRDLDTRRSSSTPSLFEENSFALKEGMAERLLRTFKRKLGRHLAPPPYN